MTQPHWISVNCWLATKLMKISTPRMRQRLLVDRAVTAAALEGDGFMDGGFVWLFVGRHHGPSRQQMLFDN